MSNRGRHKKSIDTSIERLLETIRNNNCSYHTHIKIFKDGKLSHNTTSTLRFNTKEEILNWFRNIKFIFSANAIIIDEYLFKL